MIFTRGSQTLGYDVRGEGPAVLLLHPFPFDRRFFDGLELSGFRVVTIDARGFGESTLHGDFTIDDLADDALALLDHLGIPMAAAVGSSMGGYVALSIAARRAQRLSALVLVGTRAAADGEAARQNRDAAAREIHTHGPRGFLDGVGVRLCARSEARATAQTLADTSSPDFSHALVAMLLALRNRADHTALLSTVRLPTLIVVGAQDAVSPPDEARAMKRAIPGAQLAIVPDCGHLPSLDAPADFTREVGGFLERTLAAP